MIRSREMKETVKQLTVTVLILTMVFGRCVTAFAFADRNTEDSHTGMTAAAVQTAATPSEPASPSQQTVLSASRGNGILKSGYSWLNSEAVGTNMPDRICFIDCSAGPQTVDGTLLCDWAASGDNSVRCYLVSDEDEVTLYIAFNEPKNKKVHTQSSFIFGSDVTEEVSCIDGLELLDASALTSAEEMFYGMKSLKEIDLGFLTDSKLKSLSGMFDNCESLTNLDMSNLDTSTVTDMGWMFNGCSSLTNLDVSNFDTSAVTNMGTMFADCISLTNLDVSGFDTSAVTGMGYMFGGCISLKSLDVSGFDTSAVTDMAFMFNCCMSLKSLDVSGFDTSAVEVMYSMFGGCISLKSLDVSGFDTSAVTNMASMFYNCNGLTSLDVSGFSISQSTYVCGMFAGCDRLYTVTIGKEFHPADEVLPGETDARKRAISPSIDGRWYSVNAPGTSYTSAEMNAAPAGTYQAMPVPQPQYEEHNQLGSAAPVKTGTWNDPVTDGTWSQGADGKWTYTTNAVFKNTWGYILNPYASDEANRYGWFRFDENGKMLTGWVEIGGKWYYLNTDSSRGCLGMCLINTTTPDGHKVDENGARIG